MGIGLRRGFAVAAAAGLAIVMPIQAQASAASSARPEITPPQRVGSLPMWTHQLPRTVKRGQSVWFNVWYKNVSPDQLHIGDFQLYLRNAKDVTGSGYHGISGYLLDPGTHHWQGVTSNPGKNLMDFQLPGPNTPLSDMSVQPNTLHEVYMRLTFGQNAALGTWTIQPGIDDWSLWKNGQQTIDFITDAAYSYQVTVTR